MEPAHYVTTVYNDSTALRPCCFVRKFSGSRKQTDYFIVRKSVANLVNLSVIVNLFRQSLAVLMIIQYLEC